MDRIAYVSHNCVTYPTHKRQRAQEDESDKDDEDDDGDDDADVSVNELLGRYIVG